ncbi:MBOAT family protein [Clostridium estertheticum]|uniref:MBOAT family O-acyltransferase n=1 Tax=Clostridium estertheticum TaxID=238834 RepID=UPI001C0AAB8E|nr:MBOAT family O-acyltransferase [Clostridium estertheticum]MBU3178144.1 MBOAT family protein [Clostridium estertheticum]
MVINSLNFALFFLLIVIIYFSIPYKYRWILLLSSSYIFYMSYIPKFLIVIMFSTVVSYIAAIKMGDEKDKRKRKIILISSILINIGLLILFKYLIFFTRMFNIQNNFLNNKWIVPIGISFYTLQTLSYLMDVYRGKIKAERHLGYFALYVSFFLTIFSGPIDRGTNILPQFHKKFDFNYERIVDAMKVILWGLFKKVVIADRLAVYVNEVFNNVHSYKGWPLIIAAFLFAIQLYCDFSGYTDMTIGFAKILGYDLIENFRLPYFSKSVQEFWKRWHISLSSWFGTYLYIPLGGNRVSKFRSYLNIFIVFIVSGFWHGANWTFIAWGSMHGIYQIIGKLTKQSRTSFIKNLGINPEGLFIKIYKTIITFCLVDFAWIFFRANSLSDAMYIIKNLFVGLTNIRQSSILIVPDCKLIFYSVCILFFIEVIDFNKNEFFLMRLKKKNVVIRWVVYYIIFFLIMFFGVFGNGSFIYSNF